MSEMQTENLDLLIADWYTRNAKRGASILERGEKGRVNLKRLLRDHRESPIKDLDEQLDRDCIDDLLQFYSLLEVGCIAGFLPARLPESLAHKCSRHLMNKHVRRYFGQFYPQVLPLMFCERVTGRMLLAERRSSKKVNSFNLFLTTTWDLERNKSVDMLLTLLDDYWIDETGWPQLKQVLSDFGRVGRVLLSNGEEYDATLVEATRGFMIFLDFMDGFAKLLVSCSEFPLLQSAMWHYHAYWFKHLRHRLGSVIGKAIEKIQNDCIDEAGHDTKQDEIPGSTGRQAKNLRGKEKLNAATKRRQRLKRIAEIRANVDLLVNDSFGKHLVSV